MEEQSPLFDICILCALPEEAEAVRNEFEDRCQQVSFQSAFTKKRKYPYWHAICKNLREEPLTVLVMAMPFTGPVETPIFVQAILDEFRPRFIAMTGICAGDRNRAIGDLVVASYAFHHDVGKMARGKEGQDFLRPEWRTTGPQSRIVMYAQALTTWKRPLIEMKQRLLGRDLLLEEHPRCLIAPIASGMAVQGNYPFPRLQEHNRKVEFLDQEVAAFYRTLQELPEVPFLAVKSVCDNGDPAKNDNYHDYAARASAVYLLYFIQEYVNEETMPRRDGATRLIVDSRHAETALHGQQQTMHFANEETRQEVKAQRKQFCVPVLISIHEFAPIKAKLREAHDNLWTRQKLILQADSYVKQVNAVFKTAHERAAVAGSELSIDPAGREVMDAFIEYFRAQDEYIQAMLQPLRKVHTRFFGKTDTKVLDELAKKGDEKLTALEEAIRLYVNSP
jgi:nucleoside phosphorylase